MAIQPIQQFQDPSNSLVQILQGGNQQIGSILDRAIQIGRDIANKRTQQEQDLAAMRNQETAMAQRRGENLQSVLENQRKFGMEEDKFDFLRMDTERKFGASRQDEAARAAERAAAMGQQQSQFDMNYGLSERRLDLTEDQMRMQQEERDLERQRMEAAATPPADTTPNVLAPSAAAPAGLPGGVPWKQEATDRAFVKGTGQLLTPQNDTAIPWANPFSARPAGNGPSAAPGIPELLARPGQAPAAATATTPRVDPASLKLDIRDAEKGLLAAEKLGDRNKIEGWKTRLKGLYTQEASLTEDAPPAERRAQERFEWWMQNRDTPKSGGSETTPIKTAATAAATAAQQVVEGVPEAFQNPYEFPPQGKKETTEEKTARETLGKRWATDNVSGEKQSALSMDRDTFMGRFSTRGMTPEQVKRAKDARGRLWDAAREEAAANARLRGGAAPSSATASPVDTILNMGIR